MQLSRQTKPRKQMINNIRKKGSKSKINLGYLIIIIGIIIFLIRSILIIERYNERGGYAYVQMLNFSMPIVKTQIYDESSYEENKLSIKNVALEALGVNSISTYSIIGREVSFLKHIDKLDNRNSNSSNIGSLVSSLTPFSLNNDSIEKMSEADIAELKKVSAAYDPSLKKVLDNSKPEVLIFHTHTTENYAEAGRDTTDSNFNVVGVGEVLAKELEEGYGISVIQDKTNHSISYNQSYARSNETLRSYLDTYGDFKLIIDLHRDSVANKQALTTNLNGQDLAKIMFVTGENSTRYEANKALVDKLYNIANDLFPGLTRNTYIYEIAATSINYSLSDNFALLEVGSNINSAQEAKLSAKYIARIIAEHLNRDQVE